VDALENRQRGRELFCYARRGKTSESFCVRFTLTTRSSDSSEIRTSINTRFRKREIKTARMDKNEEERRHKKNGREEDSSLRAETRSRSSIHLMTRSNVKFAFVIIFPRSSEERDNTKNRYL